MCMHTHSPTASEAQVFQNECLHLTRLKSGQFVLTRVGEEGSRLRLEPKQEIKSDLNFYFALTFT